MESIFGVKVRRRRNVGIFFKFFSFVRGRIIIDSSNNFNRVLKSLGLLIRKDGFEDVRYKFIGWFLYGFNVGDFRFGRRFYLIR